MTAQIIQDADGGSPPFKRAVRPAGVRGRELCLLLLIFVCVGFAGSVQGQADLAARFNIPDLPVIIDTEVSYTMTVTNRGSVMASGVVLSNLLPAEVEFVSADAGCSFVGGVVSCDLGALAVNAISTVGVTVRIEQLGMLTNALTVTADQSDPIPGNNTAFAVSRSIGPEPVIVVHPQDLLIGEGGGVTFTNQVEGATPFRFQWRRNGEVIPGATNSSFSVSTGLAISGGSYSVLVGNAYGVVLSDAARLVFDITQSPSPTNLWALRTPLGANLGIVRGNNVGATKEVGLEPDHGGNSGGKSVWYEWTPSVSGIVTLSTRGSTFDTLLGVYTGNSVGGLSEIASDDDGDESHTSRVRFNAEAGTSYAVAIDGYFEAEGEFVLEWDLEQTTERLPVIVTHPLGRTGLRGSAQQFSVSATGSGLSYQWLFNGDPIPGETGAILSLSSVQSTNVGHYSVAVRNSDMRTILSRSAALDIGLIPTDVLAQDKIARSFSGGSLLGSTGQDGNGGGYQAGARDGWGYGGGGGGTILVSMGIPDYHESSTVEGTTSLGEPGCSFSDKSIWLPLEPVADGCLTLNTIGSLVECSLIVWETIDGIIVSPLICSTNSHEVPVWFEAEAGAVYQVSIDGLDVEGPVLVNWLLVGESMTQLPGQDLVLSEGDPLVLEPQYGLDVYPVSYQWLHDGRLLEGETGLDFRIAEVDQDDAGEYAVEITVGGVECLQVITNLVATVEIDLRPSVEVLSVGSGENPEVQLQIESSVPFAIQASSNLVDWVTFLTNSSPEPMTEYSFPIDPVLHPQRYYRVVVHEP